MHRVGSALHGGAQVSHCGGFCCCGAQAVGVCRLSSFVTLKPLVFGTVMSPCLSPVSFDIPLVLSNTLLSFIFSSQNHICILVF